MKKYPLLFLFVSTFAQAHPYTECIDGMADFYPCENINLLHRIHLEDLGNGTASGSDIWGWTDPQDSKEYAIMGLTDGTVFVDITAPRTPVYLGFLPTATSSSTWRDMKTYDNHAFIVSEANGHGMQIFDLTQLRDVINPPVNFTATANYNEFGSAHNIVINEMTGFAYAVGADCSGGLHMMDISNPLVPINQGCFAEDGYTHDAQCVLYIGPDNEHVGKELCFNSNTDTLTIVDVTDKNTPIQLSRTPYSNSRYTHQGWLTEDQRYFLMNDELDEQNLGHNTKTYIWDLVDLDTPVIIGEYIGPQPSIDHNLYIKDNFAYLSNYTSGLSIVDITDIGNGQLTEAANFDSYPDNNSSVFDGAWSNYPFFDSGNVIVSDISGGLFVFEPLLCRADDAPGQLVTQANGDNSIAISWNDTLEPGETYSVYRSEGGCAADNFVKIADQLTTEQYTDDNVSGLVDVGYKVTRTTADGQCETTRSSCSATQTTGICTAAPQFSGIAAVSSLNKNRCGLNLTWNAGNSYCGADVSYNIYRSDNDGFTAGPDNLLASDVSDTNWTDHSVVHEETYYYLVKAIDNSNDSVDNNTLTLSATPLGVLADGEWTAGAETGDTGIGQLSRHLGWELVTDLPHSGDRSYWSQDENNACNQLTSEPLTLTQGQASELSFFTRFDIEDRWDGGVVEISVDQGPWIQPGLTPDYPTTFRSTQDQCGYAENTPSFSGTNNTWQQHTMDLSAYDGQAVQMRFSYSTDGSVNGPGWFLDDLRLTHVQVPGVCETITDLIFADGFQ